MIFAKIGENIYINGMKNKMLDSHNSRTNGLLEYIFIIAWGQKLCQIVFVKYVYLLD